MGFLNQMPGYRQLKNALRRRDRQPSWHPSEMGFVAGMSVGGADWPYVETADKPLAEQMAFLEALGEQEASCVYHCGGVMLRVPYALYPLLDRDYHPTMNGLTKPVHEMTLSEYGQRLKEVEQVIDRALTRVERSDLDCALTDAILRGVGRFNARQGDPTRRIRVLLCLFEFPPRFIVEMPRPILDRMGVDTPSESLWSKYVALHVAVTRAFVQRYCLVDDACVAAIEVINEPDYHWIPDENRIERALNPNCYPLEKYVTELHLSQIPEGRSPEIRIGRRRGAATWIRRWITGTPVLDYPWGPKFDKYVACAAELMEKVSCVAKEEAARGGAKLTVVSGAVTHCNLDYLIRMYRANPNVFRHVDAIGLHPYHWPRHDMHDQEFVSAAPTRRWRAKNPRQYAREYFKRFDFMREVSALVRMTDESASFGMAGKTIWLTEFGIPTKKAEHANAELTANRNLFIYERERRIPEQIHAITWEDKWDRFLEQVTPEFLKQNAIEALFFYTLRASGHGESSDYEHSNFSLFGSDCRTPRMEVRTFRRFVARMSKLTGRPARPEYFESEAVAGAGGEAEAGGRDWRDVDGLAWPDVPGMTQPDELKYLHWTCARRYRGRGRVVELGAFLGRSTVALASGLAASGHPQARVVSIDWHVWDEWNLEHYGKQAVMAARAAMGRLPAQVLMPAVGGSFRPLFEVFTEEVKDNVESISANLATYAWTGEPIEILFVDAAKSWPILDRILGQFFPCLVDGATVIHQDYKHFFTYWLHPVTEWMIADGVLTPTDNVSGTPSQAFRFGASTGLDLRRYQQASFSEAEVERLIEASRRRYAPDEAIKVAGAQVYHLQHSGQPDKAYREFVRTILAGGFADDYGLWDLLMLGSDMHYSLARDIVSKGRVGSGDARNGRVGAEGVGATGFALRPAVSRPSWLMLTPVDTRGYSHFVMQVGIGAHKTEAVQCLIRLRDEERDITSFEEDVVLEPGTTRSVVAKLDCARASLYVTASLVSVRPPTPHVVCYAPMLIRRRAGA